VKSSGCCSRPSCSIRLPIHLLPLPDGFVKKSGCCSRRAPFAFRYTFYRFLTVAAPLAESITYGAVTVRDCEKIRLLFSSRSIRVSTHRLPLHYGHGSVSRINYIRSRDRKGAVKGAGNAGGFECAKKEIRYFFTTP